MQLLTQELSFPDPHTADAHGLLAIGGDLSVERLLLAYNNGIFPWYDDNDPICWWSPDPRMVFDLRKDQPMKVSKSLRQSGRNRNYRITMNQSFIRVMTCCMNVSRNGDLGTWINDDLIAAYTQLHELGHAASVEVWLDKELVGGLYGVDLKEQGVFCGESMFAKATDASKLALWHLVKTLKQKDYQLIDAQLYNDHLHSLGAVTMDREVFLSFL
ncbi:leucyl/phenylalanyl-tRNA--protein transferase [Nonlabens ponticola]|uniref:Leucyl/phenylalanyl-tRNA--protein transferase n=1 Tax=Nonlabens ponticola TaxID=2496866 RepID=A0A3S9MUX8_9FLAO|nr:leucyl/phenylalanyl-tRNA--protein transferase [Nonlabens ponticola]AZQ42982.1 leucyl/phenylalanyl-tRNA--protein transferase [Nonlabens ponticola]